MVNIAYFIDIKCSEMLSKYKKGINYPENFTFLLIFEDAPSENTDDIWLDTGRTQNGGIDTSIIHDL